MARSYIPVALDRAASQRANEQCEYCRAPEHINTDPFSIEHIFPISRGGSNEEEYLALSCLGCNLLKGVSQSLVLQRRDAFQQKRRLQRTVLPRDGTV